MFIAHLPAGYLVSRITPAGVSRGALLCGSVAPDLDMLWWALVDDGRVHHHRYFTHLPAVWLAVLAVALLLPVRPRAFATGLALGVLLHAALDTVAGDIAWLWPLDDRFLSVVTVPARGHWVWSFVSHPTFLLELAIVGLAAGVAWRTRSTRPVNRWPAHTTPPPLPR